jgi:hypothetical protein
MPVTKQAYTATATWTASQLATIFESAFVDAGLMSAWHDFFLNTVENRVLRIVYDGAKVYGATCYWFQFTTTGVFVAQSSGWNTGSDIPAGPSGAGTQYLDWFSTTTNATTNHLQLLTLSTSTTVTLTRYTSGNHTFFVLRSGSTHYTFGIDHAGVTLQSWTDLDKGYHNGMVRASAFGVTSNVSSGLAMSTIFRTRRAFLDGSLVSGATAITNYRIQLPTSGWNFNSTTAWEITGGAVGSTGLLMPFGFNAANPAFTTDYNPIYTGIRHLSTVAANLPADFGITASRTNNTNAIQDTITVTPGVEVWEVLTFFNASAITNAAASSLFLARTT